VLKHILLPCLINIKYSVKPHASFVGKQKIYTLHDPRIHKPEHIQHMCITLLLCTHVVYCLSSFVVYCLPCTVSQKKNAVFITYLVISF
jgi:hypothetical protein